MSADGIGEHAHQGIATMEREHELELRLVRELQSALGAGDRAAAEALFRSLEELTEAHFLGEQLLMRLHAYPAYAAHQDEHDRLIGELRNLAEAVASPDPPDPVAAAARLERWLHAHMQSEDAALADFLQRPAAPSAS
jgi:hemerythrin-like metal-binding protein